MPAWNKRVRSLTLHGVEQNMALGARYFRFEVLEAGGDPNALRLDDAVAVLEEVSGHGRCVIVLPDERRAAPYAGHPRDGAPAGGWPRRTRPQARPAGHPPRATR